MQITTDPAALAGSLCLGLPEPVAVQASEGDWPSDVRLVLGSLAAPLATIPLAVAGAVASATIPAATVAAAHAALDGRPVPVVLIAGAGAGPDQIAGGRLWWRQESWGTDEAQSLGSVVIGPAGPTAVSADAGNAAGLGSDGLIFVSPTAGSAHVVRDEGASVTDRPALDFRGAGVTVSDDPGSGATLVTIPGGGASSLDDLTDVATAGADAGEALVFDGTNWAPSAAPVVLGTDLRLSDARTPTAHDHDDRYYTGAETDARIAAVTPASIGAATSAQGAKADSASQPGHTHTLDATTDTATRVAMTPAERTKLAQQSGTNTGDQTLPTWGTIAGKPAIIGAGATAAAARAIIGAGTSSLAVGPGPTDAKAGDYAPDLSGLVPKALIDAKGDLLVGSAADTLTRLPVGTDGQMLTADAASAGGIKWAASGGGGSAPAPSPPMHQYPVVGNARIGCAAPDGSWKYVDLNRAYYFPVYYEAAVTVDGFGCSLRGESAGSTIRLGLYASVNNTAAGWKPGAVVAQTSLGGDTSGWKQALLGTPVQIPSAGWYWHAFLATGGRMDVYSVTKANAWLDATSIESAVRADAWQGGGFESADSATFVDNPTLSVTGGPLPIVAVRFSAVP